MTEPSRPAPLQNNAQPARVGTQREIELLERIAHLTRERDALTALTHRQTAELSVSSETLTTARRHLLVADAARVAHWEWDIRSGKISLSSRWEEMIGEVAEQHFWDSQDLLSRVHPDDVPIVRAALEATFSGKTKRYLAEHRVSGVDGWIWIESLGLITECDAQGKALKLTGYNRDITQRRNMHAEVEQARAQAEESSRVKSEFLANMSHEVRTPLNAVMGLTRLLHQSTLNDEQRHYLELIDSSAGSLLALLNDVLDLSKIEAGKLVFEQIRFDVARWVREAIELHTPAAEKKGLKVDISISPEVPKMLRGDPGRLRQIMSNLMSNAVKFTDRGGIGVTLRLAPHQSDLGPHQLRLLFAVRDSGIGIPVDKQQQIFDAFTQADTSTTRRHGGTGLGLAICARLVSMMEGRIQVASRPLEGSTFRFTAVFDEANEDFSVLTEPMPLGDLPMQGLRVLLAEDHAVNALLMRKLLSQLGCIFSVAIDGEQAVRQWQEQHFDVVLMDVQMPVLSGFDATARIRQQEATDPRRHRTPIVALTAHAMAGDRERCLAAGMDAYVSKPVSPELLVQAIRDALRETREFPETRLSELEIGSHETHASFDLGKLLEIMGGDLSAVRELASAMREDIALRRTMIRQAASQGDIATLREHAHALRGACSAIFASAAAEAAKKLEAALRQGNGAAIRLEVTALEQEIAQVDVELASLLPHSN